MTSSDQIFGVLTRFGDYFTVAAIDIDGARAAAEDEIAVEGQRGDSVQQINSLSDGFSDIRADLAEIMNV